MKKFLYKYKFKILGAFILLISFAIVLYSINLPPSFLHTKKLLIIIYVVTAFTGSFVANLDKFLLKRKNK